MKLALKNKEFKILIAYNLQEANNKIQKEDFDLLILDINLPDGNGLEFLKKLRMENNVPVIILTANDMETDIVTGLESGADDYITKPFSLAVLRARVNTQLRKKLEKSTKIIIDHFIFDFDKMKFLKNDRLIELSKTEQRLLKILLLNKGITLSREFLIDRVWVDGSEYVEENALSVSIKRLRDKLEDFPSKPFYIKTVYGMGYIWVVK